MIRLLEKLLIQGDDIHREYGTLLRYTQDYQKRLSIIRKVLVQEKDLFEGRKVSDRIVSIDRHYVRPVQHDMILTKKNQKSRQTSSGTSCPAYNMGKYRKMTIKMAYEVIILGHLSSSYATVSYMDIY